MTSPRGRQRTSVLDARGGRTLYRPCGKTELITLLDELLEAERAGARVTLESAGGLGGDPIAELMQAIERDEARWCAMPAGHDVAGRAG